jgi:hypothetical protein
MGASGRPRLAPNPGRRVRLTWWLAVAGVVAVAAGCGFGPEPPDVAGPGSGAPALRVMLVGDSLLRQAEPEITDALDAHGMPAEVVDHATGGWGLLTGLYRGSPSRPAGLVGQWIAQEHPDVVVAEFSGNYWPGQDGPDDYLSLAWIQRWHAEADRFSRAVLDAGVKLDWVIPPPRSSVETTWYGLRDLPVFEGVVHPGVELIDWWTPATTFEGHWAMYLDDRDGRGTVRLRVDDGLHFTPAGRARLAEWFVAGLRPRWDTTTTSTSTTTTTGPATTTTTSQGH